ncbi:hypothetical protein [Clostridium sp. DL1XJH146]
MKQYDSTDCAAACLATICMYYKMVCYFYLYQSIYFCKGLN